MKAKHILKTEGIITLNGNAKLSEALARLKSSHDAVMVVDEDQFLGLINPFHTLIRRTYPMHTKLKNCLFSPPKLTLETDLKEAARLMLESRVHYLPVVSSNGQLLGIITARRVLRSQLQSSKAKQSARALLSNKRYLQSINLNSEFAEVLRFFQRSKLSKVVIVNQKHNLQGLISLYDLLPLFEKPQERLRFFDKSEQEARFAKYGIRHFLKTFTIRVQPEQKIGAIIALILDKEIGSVIVMKNSLQPENIITTSDLLKFLFPNI